MASGASPSSSATRSDPHKHSTAEKRAPASKEVSAVIDSLKKKLAADRCISIKRRIDENKKNVRGITQSTMRSCMERGGGSYKDGSDLLVKRQRDSPGMKSGVNASDADKSNNHSSFLEDGNASSTTMVQGSSVPVKISLRPIKMPDVKRLSPYTTWVFLDRNQRMTEDQSVVGRRRIYYDQTGGEALICSDSEEEAIDEEDEKRAFLEPEDFIIRMTLDQLGLSDSVLEELANFLSRSSSEIKARYEVLMKEKEVSESGDNQAESSLLNKDMDGALDSFDNLFCRRCLVFDCRLHGCSQDLIFPAEKPAPWTPPVDENLTCGANCYKTLLKSNRIPANGTTEDKTGTSSDGAGTKTTSKFSGKLNRKKTKTFPSESASSNEKCTPETSDSENGVQQDTNPEKVSSSSKVKASGRRGGRKRNNNRVAERVSRRTQKRQKKSEASDTDSIATGSRSASDAKHKDNEDATSSSQKHVKSGSSKNSRKNDTPVDDSKNSVKGDDPFSQSNAVASEPCSDGSLRKEEFVGENVCPGGLSEDKSWRPLEKSLFQKGVEIFGMNSCMIARNLLCGLKSCWEVFQYMTCSENKASFFGGDALNPDGSSKFDINGNMTNNQVRRRSRFLRRRGKVRRLKYTWKSAAYHSIRKRSTDKKDQPCRQFNPCNCKTACGKECTCLLNGTCCEKYCGCPKSCKNRFRGCHCAKSQCRSRQCPCFAADRECDPDVCRNCWVIGGDGTLGVPSQRGDNYECRNMKLLLKQQQRVLLGISDVSGWGAFLKNSVSKHEYLGEYTGELISHKEADKRGKIYDRENSSFLFNLNDQFVLDAYRKGDKLKFANHSPEPNCYAKVIMVAGDHRVGIFAKERILAGEELFYDYRYEPDRAPAWARKPEASGSKKDENVTPSVGRPKKVA